MADDFFKSLIGPDGQVSYDSMQRLNGLQTGFDVGGSILGALSHYQYGQQAQAAGAYEAAQLRQNANDAQAASQRTAYDVSRQTQMVSSRALAVAAASGGGASDPTVVNTISRIAGEGAYRQAVALYGGDERARLMNMQAEAKEYQGKMTAANATQVALAQGLGAGTSLLKGMAKGASLYQKYGAGAPSGAGEQSAAAPMQQDWYE